MRVRRRATEHEFNIRHREFGPGFDECVQASRHYGCRSRAADPRAQHGDAHAVQPHRIPERPRIGTAIHDQRRDMVVQIAPDRQIDNVREDRAVSQVKVLRTVLQAEIAGIGNAARFT